METSRGSSEDTARLTTSILSANINLVTGVPKTLVTVLVVLYFISSTSAWRLTPNMSFRPELTVDFASITGVLVLIDLLKLTATVSVTADDYMPRCPTCFRSWETVQSTPAILRSTLLPITPCINYLVRKTFIIGHIRQRQPIFAVSKPLARKPRTERTRNPNTNVVTVAKTFIRKSRTRTNRPLPTPPLC